MLRAIVGGTGRFIGTRGEMISTPPGDVWYEHRSFWPTDGGRSFALGASAGPHRWRRSCAAVTVAESLKPVPGLARTSKRRWFWSASGGACVFRTDPARVLSSKRQHPPPHDSVEVLRPAIGKRVPEGLRRSNRDRRGRGTRRTATRRSKLPSAGQPPTLEDPRARFGRGAGDLRRSRSPPDHRISAPLLRSIHAARDGDSGRASIRNVGRPRPILASLGSASNASAPPRTDGGRSHDDGVHPVRVPRSTDHRSGTAIARSDRRT